MMKDRYGVELSFWGYTNWIARIRLSNRVISYDTVNFMIYRESDE